MTKITLEFAQDLNVDERELKEAAIVYLYAAGTISEKQACQALGYSRVKFDQVLTEKYGIPRLNSPEDIDIELSAYTHHHPTP